ncbi:hypothetical protein C8R44DRAFT_802775 [Mycena epipterygia]|nr:hypothetical protein C8R44DRAFT_802775 [Mycena epipterygia]
MLRASWALVSLPFIPGARSRLDRPIPAFFSPNLRLWLQDRSFVSGPKWSTANGPPFIDTATPEVASDDTIKTPEEAAPDIFTPSTGMSSNFRFPPFPLALTEEAEPKISAAPEPETDTDIFEPPSPEYTRVYERLPKPSADILTQVVRSLPELLPEPETDPGSIFEDSSHIDYAGISTSSVPPITSTRALEILVAGRKYDEALRVLDALLEVGTEIPFSSSYEMAAISAVKSPAQTKTEIDDQIETFKKWFSLIPPADQSRPRTFRRLRDYIMLSPLNSLRLIMEFGLIAAEKGFASSTHYRVTRLVATNGEPDVTLQFIDELRRRNRTFLERSSQRADADIQDRKLHVDIVGAAVRALASAGHFDHAVQLIPDPLETNFHLTPYSYTFLLRKMQGTKDSRYLPHINFVAQHKSETRFRDTGLKRMDKDKLAMSIRCLANVGEFDLAMGLLSNLEATEVALVPTLQVLLARLQSGGDDRYLPYIEHISRLQQTIPVTSPVPAASSAPETPDGQPTRLVVDKENNFGRAIEALTRAWCLDEAVALLPVYHRTNTRNITGIYNLVLWKLKTSNNPKYYSYVERVTQMSAETSTLARQARLEAFDKKVAREVRLAELEAKARARSEAAAATYLEDFAAEDIYLSSFLPSQPPQPVTRLGAALRALKIGFRAASPSHRPHPVTVVRFMELYLASGRTRAIPLLRNFVLRYVLSGKTHPHAHNHALSYIFAEMLYHARNQQPDLVIHTFVTHFYIVGLPRDELFIRLRAMEHDPETMNIWAAEPRMKLHPNLTHTSAVWRALIEVTREERAILDLYSKLLKFADLRSVKTSMLHPGVPLLNPPPAWKAGAESAAFTPFVRRMSQRFGAERGELVLKDMLDLGINPHIHIFTELAMAYARTGDVVKTLSVLGQMERALTAWESVDAAKAKDAELAEGDKPVRRRRKLKDYLIPRVDQVFYIAVVRGLLMSKKIAAAREVETRMYKRYGYVAGKNRYLDELYNDLEVAEAEESGTPIPRRAPLISDLKNAPLENPQNIAPVPDSSWDASSSAGA